MARKHTPTLFLILIALSAGMVMGGIQLTQTTNTGPSTMKNMSLQALSTADYSPDYRPGKSGGLTNGNIIIGGHTYSDDGGETWNDVTDTSLNAQYDPTDVGCIQIDGNTVYKVIGPGSLTNRFVMYESADGITYTQVDNTIDVATEDGSPANKTYYPIIGGAQSTLGGYEMVIFLRVDDTSGLPDEIISMFNYGAGGWHITSGGLTFGKIYSFPANETWYPAVRRSYAAGTGSTDGIFFTVMVKNSSSGAEYLRILQYVASPTPGFSTLYNCQSIDTDQELRIDYSDSDFTYISKNAFAETTDGDFLIAGDLYDNDGGAVDNSDATVKYDLSEDTLTKVSTIKINPIRGAGSKVWGYIIDGTETYLSVNSGESFYLHKTSTGRSWDGGVVFLSTTLGAGFFDGDTFYTLQDALETDITYAEVNLKQKNYSFAQLMGNFNWNTNQILDLYDENTTPTLLFLGILSPEGRQGFGANRTFEFDGLDFRALTTPVDLDYRETATEIATIAKAAIDQVPFLSYTTLSIPTFSITHNTEHDQSKLVEVLDELASTVNGTWYITPEGVIWIKKQTNLVDSTLVWSQATTGIDRPYISYSQSTYNKVIVYGSGFLMATDEDEASILLNGEKPLSFNYPGVTDQTKLKAIATSILARDGIYTPPLSFEFQFSELNYIQPGETFNYQWIYEDLFLVAADFIFDQVIYYSNHQADIIGTNFIPVSRGEE